MRIFQRPASRFMNLPINIRLFFLANVLYQIGTGMFGVLYNLYIRDIGYSDAMNGTVVSVQSLATALMFIPIGFLGDRGSRKQLLVIGAMLSGISLIVRAWTEQSTGLLGLAVVTGIFSSVFQVLAIPFLAENTKKSERMRIFSYHASLMLGAQVLGGMGGGFLADLLQFTGISRVTSLSIVLMIGGVSALAAFLPLLFTQEVSAVAEKEPQEAPAPVQTEAQRRQSDRQDLKVIGQFTIAQLLIGLGSGLVVPYLNLYFTNRFEVSLSAVGILISLGQIMTIFSMLIGPWLVRRLGAVTSVLCFQLLSLPFLLITGFTNIFAVAAIGFLFRQALMNAANPIQASILVERVPDHRRGIANSFTQTAFMMGWATMGPVQAALVTHYGSYWGYAITFCITGVLYIAASFMYYFMFREKKAQAL
ncbi:major facilitator superfamily MFS_1 [Paenibacillus algicola]|uniref:Major facilitator superfamily MFS_1 n=2 Tax=Paenibacillus TaxID=44249 RepID=A0A4P8XMY4_9BACL|nr:major facilitator superfamily MFS_1 [Paenibacillus algicola]